MREVGEVKEEFENLGVEYSVARRRLVTKKWTFKPTRVNKAQRMLERIGKCTGAWRKKRRLVEILVIPALRWAGQWRTNDDLKKMAC